MYSSIRPGRPGSSTSNAERCVLCRQSFTSRPLPFVTQTECGHRLHTHCLNKWLPTKKMCPICHFSIPKWRIKCLLCSWPFKCGDTVLSNQCDHPFHEQCILRHLQSQKVCPICQAPCWEGWTMKVRTCNHCKNCVDPADKQCTICLTKFVNGDAVKKLPCDHEFHDACLRPWLEKKMTCPLCRTDLMRS